jgi:GTP 3',8-cyclase
MAHEWRCHAVQNGWFYKCPLGHVLPQFIEPLKEQGVHDGVRISDAPGFFDELHAYLTSPDPLASCSYCRGTMGRSFSHEQVARNTFRSFQQRPTEDLLDWAHLRYTRLERLVPAWLHELPKGRFRAVLRRALGARTGSGWVSRRVRARSAIP